jgi:hypothetical protein
LLSMMKTSSCTFFWISRCLTPPPRITDMAHEPSPSRARTKNTPAMVSLQWNGQ